jgi:hypothetical protein
LRTGDVNVSEIGCKLRQQALDIGPVAIPRNESMDRGGVPQIMKAWLIASAVAPKNASTISYAAESDFSGVATQRPTVPERKQRSVGLTGITPAASGNELPECFGEVVPQRYQPGPVELALADAQHGMLQIHVCHCEGQRLANPESSVRIPVIVTDISGIVTADSVLS